MVLPEFNAAVEGSDEEGRSFGGTNDVASLRDDLDFFVVVVVHLDDCVLESFFEERVVVCSCCLAISIEPVLYRFRDVQVDG